MQMLIGRKRQAEELRAALQSEGSQLLVLTGRRGVGKSFLVRHVLGDQVDFSATGLPQGTKQDQLRNLLIHLHTAFGDAGIHTHSQSWPEVFELLSSSLRKVRKNGKQVVVLNELPWMATKRAGFLDAFRQFLIQHRTQNILVVITASSASWIAEKLLPSQADDGLAIRVLHLEPFTLDEVRQFLSAKGMHYSLPEILKLYMILGGIPKYLAHLSPGQTITQNLDRICFGPDANMQPELLRLLATLFERHARHLEILEALVSADKGMTRDEIISAVSLKNGGTLTKILSELSMNGLVSQHGAYGKKKKNTLYRVRDYFSLFYFSFLHENEGKIFSGLEQLPGWDRWSDYAFQNVCLDHSDQIRKALGISGIKSSITSFSKTGTQGKPSPQIELLIDRSDRTMNICTMKFNNQPLDLSSDFLRTVEEKKESIATTHGQAPTPFFDGPHPIWFVRNSKKQ